MKLNFILFYTNSWLFWCFLWLIRSPGESGMRECKLARHPQHQDTKAVHQSRQFICSSWAVIYGFCCVLNRVVGQIDRSIRSTPSNGREIYTHHNLIYSNWATIRLHEKLFCESICSERGRLMLGLFGRVLATPSAIRGRGSYSYGIESEWEWSGTDPVYTASASLAFSEDLNKRLASIMHKPCGQSAPKSVAPEQIHPDSKV